MPWGRHNLWKWVPGISLGVKAAGAYGWRPITPCRAETLRKSWALTYPEPLVPPRTVAGDIYFTLLYLLYFSLLYFTLLYLLYLLYFTLLYLLYFIYFTLLYFIYFTLLFFTLLYFIYFTFLYFTLLYFIYFTFLYFILLYFICFIYFTLLYLLYFIYFTLLYFTLLYSFLLELNQPQGQSATGGIRSIKNFSDTIGNRTRDLWACNTVPQQTAPPGGLPTKINDQKLT